MKGFFIHKSDTSSVQPWEYVPAAGGEYKSGQLLSVVDGVAAEIIFEDYSKIPPYLCMADKTAANGDLIPVTRVSSLHIYEVVVPLDSVGPLNIGDRIKISSDGLSLMEGNGPFEIVEFDETEHGIVVRGRFIDAVATVTPSAAVFAEGVYDGLGDGAVVGSGE